MAREDQEGVGCRMAEKFKNMVFQNNQRIIQSEQSHHNQDDRQYSEQIGT